MSIPGILCIWPIVKQLHSAFTCQRTESTYLWIFRTGIVCNPSCEDGSGRLLDPRGYGKKHQPQCLAKQTGIHPSWLVRWTLDLAAHIVLFLCLQSSWAQREIKKWHFSVTLSLKHPWLPQLYWVPAGYFSRNFILSLVKSWITCCSNTQQR